MISNITTVDIIILTLNEEKYIKKCLESVLSFIKPPNCSLKIYIVDGGSTDKTLEKIKGIQHDSLVVLHNEKKIQSAGMNLAIRQSRGDFVMRLDAHTIFPDDYLKNCLDTALRTKADMWEV